MSWLMIASACLSLALLLRIHSQSDTTVFDYTRFNRNEPELILQGDARVLATILSLTTSSSVGRVLYSPPIRLWDRPGRRQANFQTAFTGIISGFEAPDGISFFVVPVNSAIPTVDTTGGNMGLYNNSSGTSPVPLVAVELDVTVDTWDPNYRHVGINVDSRESVAFERWDSGRGGGFEGGNFEVRITYDARQRMISAYVNGDIWNSDPDPVVAMVEHSIDLKEVLPEWVQIGISASTRRGGYAEHFIHTWSFISFLVSDDVSTPEEEKDTHNRQYA